MAEEEIITKIKKYLRDLTEAGININRAFLYGSYANGNMTDNSDIDLLIVSDKIDIDSDQTASIAWKLTRKTDSRIEPYLISTKRFDEDNISPLIQAVKKDGIEILQ